MKAKAFLFLAAGLCLFLVGGFVTTQMVTAQINTKLPWPPTNVVFDEDPYRQHGMQAKSYITTASGYVLVDTVPLDKKFIIMDIFARDEAGSPRISVYLSTQPDGSTMKAIIGLGIGDNPLCISLRSGVVFEPGESIYIKNTQGGSATICGYYVDL